jgi:hypothetical protein
MSGLPGTGSRWWQGAAAIALLTLINHYPVLQGRVPLPME